MSAYFVLSSLILARFMSRPKPAGSGNNRFRIIGGEWRSRVLHFSGEVAGLRPTTDRIRETVFNWLQALVPGARCLDLFSGSGALAFEACSRGANSVVAVESSAVAAQSLRQNARMLGCSNLEIKQRDAMTWLQDGDPDAPYDIIFLDPPYRLQVLETCCGHIETGRWLVPGGLVYLEADTPLDRIGYPGTWELVRHKKAGQVSFGLCQRIAAGK